MFDLISIGDTVIDTLIPLSEAQLLEQDGENYLSLPYSHKVPVEQSVSMVGGNAANNAVGASRLGLKTAIYTNVGNKDDDEADDRIIARFKKEKVDTRYVAQTPDLPSNHNVILEYKGERTILIHHQPWKFELPDLEKSKWVYLTSMSPSYAQSNIMEQILNYLERSGTRLVFQPGTFQIKQGLRKLSRIFAKSEVLILNKDEAKLLLELPDETNVKKMMKKLNDLGVQKVFITDGAQGSFCFDSQKYFKMGVFPARKVDATGAGDAFSTGVLAALFYGQEVPEALRWGSANSASVLEVYGPQEGLLSFENLQNKLKENTNLIPKVF